MQEEVGPFVYEQQAIKLNVTFSDDDTEVSFNVGWVSTNMTMHEHPLDSIALARLCCVGRLSVNEEHFVGRSPMVLCQVLNF